MLQNMMTHTVDASERAFGNPGTQRAPGPNHENQGRALKQSATNPTPAFYATAPRLLPAQEREQVDVLTRRQSRPGRRMRHPLQHRLLWHALHLRPAHTPPAAQAGITRMGDCAP